ncbi:MAG: cytochrome c-type biogenesis protein CcmH [Chloroflexi bacterium]|nr:cytochrome c-type biogenesis protein CcmH [Chloroflexota bacterium]
MTRHLPTIALGALLALAALSIVLSVRSGPGPTLSERAGALARELRCPDCQGLSVADSPTSSAREIRRQIDELLATGGSDQAVRNHFVARYGDWILLAPRSPLPWLVPLAFVIAGIAGMVAWLAGRTRPPPAASPLTAEERRGLREEAEALDA